MHNSFTENTGSQTLGEGGVSSRRRKQQKMTEEGERAAQKMMSLTQMYLLFVAQSFLLGFS